MKKSSEVSTAKYNTYLDKRGTFWDFEDEKFFIDHLGQFRTDNKNELPYAELLRRYIIGTNQREYTSWKYPALQYARDKYHQYTGEDYYE